jgi:hypothetical protein
MDCLNMFKLSMDFTEHVEFLFSSFKEFAAVVVFSGDAFEACFN